MTNELSKALAHPFTIVLAGSFLASVGYLIGIVVGLIRDNSKLIQATDEISKILEHVVARQDTVDRDMGIIKSDLQELLGEHRAMVRTGAIIAAHAQQRAAE